MTGKKLLEAVMADLMFAGFDLFQIARVDESDRSFRNSGEVMIRDRNIYLQFFTDRGDYGVHLTNSTGSRGMSWKHLSILLGLSTVEEVVNSMNTKFSLISHHRRDVRKTLKLIKQYDAPIQQAFQNSKCKATFEKVDRIMKEVTEAYTRKLGASR